MKFLKTRKAAALALVLAVAFATLYGSHRSLNSWRSMYEANNYLVLKDLQTRVNVCQNLCTVAGRYLPEDDPARMKVEGTLRMLDPQGDPHGGEPGNYKRLSEQAQELIAVLETQPLTAQDAKYVSGFQAQLESLDFTIAHDDYNQMARRYNEEDLGSFPANVLAPLTGVGPLPIYE